MSPRHQLIVIVGAIAAFIAVAWVILFRTHALTPPITAPSGPTLSEIGQAFEQSAEQLRRFTDEPAAAVPVAAPPPVNGMSDDARTPATPER